MSRQALIFRRRQTQHKGSPEPSEVSAPQTEHFAGFLRLSVASDRLACSRISGAITGSDLSGIFLFISVLTESTIARNRAARQSRKVLRWLCRFCYLYYYGYIQRSPASRTPLSRRHLRPFPKDIDDRRHRMGANRTVGHPAYAFFNDRFHRLLPSQDRTQKPAPRLCQFTNIFKPCHH